MRITKIVKKLILLQTTATFIAIAALILILIGGNIKPKNSSTTLSSDSNTVYINVDLSKSSKIDLDDYIDPILGKIETITNSKTNKVLSGNVLDVSKDYPNSWQINFMPYFTKGRKININFNYIKPKLIMIQNSTDDKEYSDVLDNTDNLVDVYNKNKDKVFYEDKDMKRPIIDFENYKGREIYAVSDKVSKHVYVSFDINKQNAKFSGDTFFAVSKDTYLDSKKIPKITPNAGYILDGFTPSLSLDKYYTKNTTHTANIIKDNMVVNNIEFRYEKTNELIDINLLNISSNPLEYKGLENSKIDIKFNHKFEGFKLVENDLFISKTNTTQVVYFKEDPKANNPHIIDYVDENSKIIRSQEVKGYIGQVIEIQYLDIDGYTINTENITSVTITDSIATHSKVYITKILPQYVTITFLKGDHGSLDGVFEYRVIKGLVLNDEKQPQITPPTIIADRGYKTTTNMFSPVFNITAILNENTTYTAQYEIDKNQKFAYKINYISNDEPSIQVAEKVVGTASLDEIINIEHKTIVGYIIQPNQATTLSVKPTLDSDSTTNTVNIVYAKDPTYVDLMINFVVDETKVTHTGQLVFSVKPNQTLRENNITEPVITPKRGYKLSTPRWDKLVDLDAPITQNTTFTLNVEVDKAVEFNSVVEYRYLNNNELIDSSILNMTSNPSILKGYIGEVLNISNPDIPGYKVSNTSSSNITVSYYETDDISNYSKAVVYYEIDNDQVVTLTFDKGLNGEFTNDSLKTIVILKNFAINDSRQLNNIDNLDIEITPNYGYIFKGFTDFDKTKTVTENITYTAEYEVDKTITSFTGVVNYVLSNGDVVSDIPQLVVRGYIGQNIALTHPTSNLGYKISQNQPTSITILEDNSAKLDVLYEIDDTKFVTLTFLQGDHGVFTNPGVKTIQVLKTVAINSDNQLNKISNLNIEITPDTGYIFDGFENYDETSIVNVSQTFTAQYHLDQNSLVDVKFNIGYKSTTNDTLQFKAIKGLSALDLKQLTITKPNMVLKPGYLVDKIENYDNSFIIQEDTEFVVIYKKDLDKWTDITIDASTDGQVIGEKTISVVKDLRFGDQEIDIPEISANPGYNLSGFSPVINDDTIVSSHATFTAQYTKYSVVSEASYMIRYLYYGSDKLIEKELLGGKNPIVRKGLKDQKVTVMKYDVLGYLPKDFKPYITLHAGNNIIDVYYDVDITQNKSKYTINYLDKTTQNKIKESSTLQSYINTYVEVEIPNINGYIVDSNQVREYKVLNDNNQEFNIYYNSLNDSTNPEVYTYIVKSVIKDTNKRVFDIEDKLYQVKKDSSVTITPSISNSGYIAESNQNLEYTINSNMFIITINYVMDENKFVTITFKPGLNGEFAPNTKLEYKVLKGYVLSHEIQPEFDVPRPVGKDKYTFTGYNKVINLSMQLYNDLELTAQYSKTTLGVVVVNYVYDNGEMISDDILGFENGKVYTQEVGSLIQIKRDITTELVPKYTYNSISVKEGYLNVELGYAQSDNLKSYNYTLRYIDKETNDVIEETDTIKGSEKAGFLLKFDIKKYNNYLIDPTQKQEFVIQSIDNQIFDVKYNKKTNSLDVYNITVNYLLNDSSQTPLTGFETPVVYQVTKGENFTIPTPKSLVYTIVNPTHVIQNVSADVTHNVLYSKNVGQFVKIKFITDHNGRIDGQDEFIVNSKIQLSDPLQENRVEIPKITPREGFKFVGFLPKFDINMIATGPRTFEAQYERVAQVAYEIRYYYKDTLIPKEMLKSENPIYSSGHIGDIININILKVPLLRPEINTVNKHILIDGTNIIYVRYVDDKDAPNQEKHTYAIKFLDNNSRKEIAQEVIKEGLLNSRMVIDIPQIDGYKLVDGQNLFYLVKDVSPQVVELLFESLSIAQTQVYNYKIRYLVDGSENMVPGLNATTHQGIVNSQFTLSAPLSDRGYMPKQGQNLTYKLNKNDLVFDILYVRDNSQFIKIEFQTDDSGVFIGRTEFNILKKFPVNSPLQLDKLVVPVVSENKGFQFLDFSPIVNFTEIRNTDMIYTATYKKLTLVEYRITFLTLPSVTWVPAELVGGQNPIVGQAYPNEIIEINLYNIAGFNLNVESKDNIFRYSLQNGSNNMNIFYIKDEQNKMKINYTLEFLERGTNTKIKEDVVLSQEFGTEKFLWEYILIDGYKIVYDQKVAYSPTLAKNQVLKIYYDKTPNPTDKTYNILVVPHLKNTIGDAVPAVYAQAYQAVQNSKFTFTPMSSYLGYKPVDGQTYEYIIDHDIFKISVAYEKDLTRFGKIVFDVGSHGKALGKTEFEMLKGIKINDLEQPNGFQFPVIKADEGYEFTGFSPEIDITLAFQNDITLVAQYRKIPEATYKVVYMDKTNNMPLDKDLVGGNNPISVVKYEGYILNIKLYEIPNYQLEYNTKNVVTLTSGVNVYTINYYVDNPNKVKYNYTVKYVDIVTNNSISVDTTGSAIAGNMISLDQKTIANYTVKAGQETQVLLSKEDQVFIIYYSSNN